MSTTPLLQQPLFSSALPRSANLTDALLAPAAGLISAGDAQTLRAAFVRRAVREGHAAAGTIRVDGYLLRRGADPDLRAMRSFEAFSWSPFTARRMVGLAAVRTCVHGTRRTPVQAVGAVIDELCRQGADPRERSGSLAAWLASTTPGVRALVHAEAVTWATQLLGALDWARLGRSASVGGPDEWWDHRPAALTLRGRSEVRIRLGAVGGEARGGRALFSVLSGRPGKNSHAELGLSALVSVLAAPTGPPPVRVAGWWPESGRALIVPVDGALLEATMTSVLDVVEAARGQGGS